MEDFFPKMSLKPNKDCDDYHCRKQQKKFAEEEVERLKNQPEIVETLDATNEIVHEENDWGISLVADDDDNDDVPGIDFVNFTVHSDLDCRIVSKKDFQISRNIYLPDIYSC